MSLIQDFQQVGAATNPVSVGVTVSGSNTAVYALVAYVDVTPPASPTADVDAVSMTRLHAILQDNTNSWLFRLTGIAPGAVTVNVDNPESRPMVVQVYACSDVDPVTPEGTIQTGQGAAGSTGTLTVNDNAPDEIGISGIAVGNDRTSTLDATGADQQDPEDGILVEILMTTAPTGGATRMPAKTGDMVASWAIGSNASFVHFAFALNSVVSAPTYEVTRKVFDTGTGAIGSKIVITGAPSEPKAIILKLAGNVGSADGVTSQDMRQATGFAGKRLGVITQGVCGTSALDGAGTTDAHRWLRDDAIIEVRDPAGVDNGRAFIDTFDATGITLEIASVFNQSYRVELIMLGGPALTDAEMESFFLPIANGNFDVTVYNFQPDCMLLVSEFDPDPILPENHSGGVNGMGVCVSVTEQGMLTHRDQGAVATTDNKTACHQGSECFAEARSTTPDARIAFVAFLVDGARFNMIELQNADRCIGLALKGGDYSIKEMLTEIDIVTDIDVVGLPSEPAGGIVFSGFRTEDAPNVQQPDFRQSIGFWDASGSQGVQAAYGEDGVGVSNVATGQRGDAVYQSINNTPAQDGAMAFISKGPTSAKFRMIDADPSVRFTFGLFFGPAVPFVAAPPVGPTGLVATAISPTQIDLAWTDNAIDETEYRVERESPVGGGFSLLAIIPANSEAFSDTTVTPGTQFNYRVRACKT